MDISAQPYKLRAGIMPLKLLCQVSEISVLRRVSSRWSGWYWAAPVLWRLLELIRVAFCSNTQHRAWQTGQESQTEDEMLQELQSLPTSFSFLWDLFSAGSAP